MRRLLLLAVVSSAALFVSAEVSIRSLGLTNYPIYSRAPGVIYFQTPNQHGSFKNQNLWYVNDQGFGNAEPWTSSGKNCLLVGDSVVHGGNLVDHSRRIGTLAAKKWGHTVWVVSAGGWNLLNELEFLRLHPNQVKAANCIVFVLNNGDFGKAGSWDPVPFPTSKPSLATPYFIKRYIAPHFSDLPQIDTSVDRASEERWSYLLDDFLENYRGPVTFVLYPNKQALLDKQLWEKNTSIIRSYVGRHRDRIHIYDLRSAGSLRTGFYRDEIHPNPIGNEFIAEVISDVCRESGSVYTQLSPKSRG